ncbi:MAG: NTP transferase domain-containing protein [Myxococcales bacterium]|nr:NTP transferase domain-containing protein [Myxococcales bacterium]MCB9577240.1 NTP transferase domain-containing protein [Polyangiaceae bacterium]
MSQAMILCAGLGTRLRPLTDELPKPLVPVGDRPLLAHITARLRSQGIHQVVLNTHHLPRAFDSVYEWLDVEVKVVHEPEIRGTAGGVAGARRHFSSAPVLVWNGDILADPPVGRLLEGAALGGACLAVAPRGRGEGTVGLDADGHVVRVRGEQFGDEVAGGDYLGIAALGARTLRALPDKGCLIGDVVLPELRAGGVVPSVRVAGRWSDLGDVASYMEENQRFLDERGVESWIAPRSTVMDSVSPERSIVGPGAHVFGYGKLRRVVVWPGAEVRAPLDNAVVTRSGRIVRIA